MAHKFESDRPEHRVHNMRIPTNHSHLDQKHDKMGRSPMIGQLPMENGLESASPAPELNSNEGNM